MLYDGEKQYRVEYFKECYPDRDDCGYIQVSTKQEAHNLYWDYLKRGYQARMVTVRFSEDYEDFEEV